MADKIFKDTLEALLKKDKRLVDEHKELNLGMIRELADKTDEKLIELLLSNDETAKKFFIKVKNVLVFKQHDLKFFLDANQIDNSYTDFENRIGLASGSRLLKDNSEVVLNFPFKDCVLEGGQTTEEGTDEYYYYNENDQKFELSEAQRNEIFFNEVLAQDEIDRLFEPKAFNDIVKYTGKGKETFKAFTRDEEGTITDNLIIKGNNLLALHSLKEEFTDRVKLIYIDPPYNTGGDSFKYNDRFNHSTWMTFMKNRLEVASQLLKDEGVIFIQIDERELAYLKVLCDEVLGRENFVIQINWQRTTQRTVLGQGATPVINIVEYILCYLKNSNRKDDALNKIQKIIPSNDKMYNQYNLMMKTEGKRVLHKTLNQNGQEIKIYKHSGFELESIPAKTRSEEHYIKHFDFIVRKDSQQQESSLEQVIMSNIQKNDTLFSVERILKQGKRKGELSKSFYMNDNVIYYLKTYAAVIDKKIFRKVDMNNLWLDYEISSAGIAEEGGVILKRGKKPEELIRRIIEIGTKNENDIVMDFHVGSGTTAAVAHKLKRQYIGIEQLDYGKNDSVARLKNVIKGDSSGISEHDKVSWKGGGSFIYLEIKKWNEEAKEKVRESKSLKELEKLLAELSEKYFLNYNVKFKEFQKKIIKEKEFIALSLPKQKEMFAKMLDLNQLYVNASEMEDKKYGMTKEDIALTKNFYNQ
jgi:adenine-specific DNA-methyltransferase